MKSVTKIKQDVNPFPFCLNNFGRLLDHQKCKITFKNLLKRKITIPCVQLSSEETPKDTFYEV